MFPLRLTDGNTLQTNPSSNAPLFLNTFNLFSDVRDPNRPRIEHCAPQFVQSAADLPLASSALFALRIKPWELGR